MRRTTYCLLSMKASPITCPARFENPYSDPKRALVLLHLHLGVA
jgi:hypothetical protein